MKFNNTIRFILLTLLASMYLFPIGFRGLPEALNTKQILAVAGVVLFTLKVSGEKAARVPGHYIVSFLFAAVFSVWCYSCCIANGTSDYTYATYFISYFVWVFGAVGTCGLIELGEKKVDLATVTKYLTAACIFQCVAVVLVDNSHAFASFVNTWFLQDTTPLRVNRLYGIGCSLDSGGVRMSCVLILIAHQICTDKKVLENKRSLYLYIASFLIISVIGNMIARTTSVGAILGIIYFIVSYGYFRYGEVSGRQARAIGVGTLLIALAVVIVVVLYNISPDARYQIRFAFEGFFSYFETGVFRTGSTDRLNSIMWVWPWDTAGWIRGYGLFEWSSWSHFMTDIGYCRFTLYCGLVGMTVFALYFVYNSIVVARWFKDAKFLAFLLAALTFFIWLKVSTDIFQIYALLFCLKSTIDDPEPDAESDLQLE